MNKQQALMQLRERVQTDLGRPVSDEEWDFVVGRGVADRAVSVDSAYDELLDELEDLIDHDTRVIAKSRRGRGRPPRSNSGAGQLRPETRARMDLLARIAADLASTLPEVKAFRTDVLGGTLI